ncbi:monocarboxylate transporter 9-like isoform X1 [Centruroides vittatus]|uniref:monocarboxylate transporter 9-like isoform X1 n=3 Tax=Centruroides vittatus TaxID=120091 RepID=UPI00350EB102
MAEIKHESSNIFVNQNNNKDQITENGLEETKNLHSTQFKPPDGGWGWVVVFASFMVSFVADGITHSFGLLFVEFFDFFGASKSTTAWAGSLFFSLPLLTGPIASYFTDRWGCRMVTIIGSLITTFAFAAGFLATKLDHLIIAFSISALGLSLCYVASIVIVAYYFDRKRSLANGLATCGAGVGTIAFPYITNYLIKMYTWRGTLLLLAGAFLNMTVFGCLMRDLDYPEDLSSSSSDNDERKSNLSDSQIEESLSTSLVQLPTYIKNKNLNPEVIQELSNKEGGHLNSLLEQHPDFLSSYLQNMEDSLPVRDIKSVDGECLPGVKLRRREKQLSGHQKEQQCPLMPGFYICQRHPSYFRNIRIHPGNLMYRGAMLNIPPYYLRTSSCPNIYKNYLSGKIKGEKYQFLSGLKELLLDMVDIRIFKNVPYTVFCLSNLLLYACADIPYVYIPDYVEGLDPNLNWVSSSLISILGVFNTVGMIIFGYVGDKSFVDPSLVYAITMCVSGIAIGCLPFLKNYIGMAIAVSTYGFTVSTNYALTASLLVELISLDNFTNAYGLLLSVQGIATLVGPPFGGWLYDTYGSYDIPFCTAGICTLLSGLVVLPLCKKLKWRKINSTKPPTSEDVI